jgi:hypothetical protein
MIRLDTTKFKFPIDVLNQYDLSKYEEGTKNKCGIVRKRNWVLENEYKPPGVNYIEVQQDNSVIITLSAKILQDNYIDGININTIEQAINRMKETGCIDLDSNRAIELGEILKCDVTNTTYCNPEDWDLLKMGLMVCINDKRVSVDNYVRKNNKGIEFNGLYRTKDERMIIYPKDDEMRPIRRNKAFFDTLSRPEIMRHKMINMKRVESNLKTQKSIREQLGTSAIYTTPILDVFESKAKLNYNAIHNYIKLDQKNLAFMQDYTNMKYSKIESEMGILYIAQQLSNNPDLIKAWLIQHKGKKHYHEKLKEYLRVIRTQQIRKEGSGKKIVSIMNDFKNQLK